MATETTPSGGTMERIEDGGPAFPVFTGDQGVGMSLRDWFAGQALLTAQHRYSGVDPLPAEWLAERAYGIADAMLKARAR
jgi:hypothetical protein